MNDAHIYSLIQRYFISPPDDLSDAEADELRAALKFNKNYRDFFRRAATIDAELRYVAGEVADDSNNESMQQNIPPVTLVEAADRKQQKSWHSGRYRWQAWALAATLLVAASVGWSLRRSDDGEESAAIARLAGGHDYSFADSFNPIDDQFETARYQLLTGAIAMKFDNNVVVTIESPADFEIESGDGIKLVQGRARAVVPESGHGFVVDTPNGEIEDLGTEFGVFVDQDQQTELHVFAGEVNLHGTADSPLRLTEGNALSMKEGQPSPLATTDDGAFATGASIGFDRWQAAQQSLKHDPSLVVYYDFERAADSSDQMPDQSLSTPSINGNIQGGIWASGRWQNKGALLFENFGDRIELDIPGEYPQVTISVWLQVNRFDQALQTVFNTLDWDEGEHHWNLLRDGGFRVGFPEKYTFSCRNRVVPTGRWTHIAASIDAEAGVARYYIDGDQIDQAQWTPNGPIRFGPCTIGAFGRVDEHSGELEYSRELRGRMDEFAVFGRCLTSDEIQSMYESGSGFN